jgi:hypothetical protein
MPTLQQLPLTVTTGPADRIPIEQNGQTCTVSIDTLLAPTQPQLSLASGTLLGRVSAGYGTPEPVGVGTGLTITNGLLTTQNAAPAVVVPGTYTKVTVNAAGVVTNGTTLAASDVLGLDVSGATVAVAGGPERSLATRALDRLNVLDFGAVADGVTNAGAAISSAVTAAAALPMGGEVYFPAGRYRINMAVSAIFAASHVVLRGAGRGKTVLFIDDSVGNNGANGGNAGITNATAGGVRPPITDFHLRELTLLGTRDLAGQNVSSGSFLVNLKNITNISIEDCEFLNSRGFSLGLFTGTDVMVRGNRVMNSNVDSIAVWDVFNAVITDNQIEMSGDDSISAHTSDATVAPPRSGLVISNNSISDGPGIKVLGAKAVTITGNIIRRSRNNGIQVGFDAYFLQGNTPNFAIQIINNVIEDVVNPLGFVAGTVGSRYIWVGGASKQAGSGASAPGVPVPSTGVVTPLYGSATGNFYTNAQSDSVNGYTVVGTVASPGGYWLRVEGNTLVRTLPAVTTWSQWGYGSAWQVGQSGAYNGPITETMLNQPGIHITVALRNSRIAGNIIQTTGPNGIEFDPGVSDMDYDGLEIVGNRLADFSQHGIFWPTSAVSNQRIRIVGNDFDGDPYFKSASRASNGTWNTTGAAVVGLNLTFLSGVEIEGNHFRNLTQTTTQSISAFNVLRRNVVHCNPAAVGYDAANQGVGIIPAAGGDFSHVIEICDPTDAKFGEISSPTLASSSLQPASGTYVTGCFVGASQPVVVNGQSFLGWMRLTTGSSHIAGTDWAAVFGASGAAVPNAALVGGNGATLSGVGIGEGLSFVGGVLSASGMPQLEVTSTYVAAGPISPTDTVALVNAASAVSMTLATGSVDGHELVVKRFGAGVVTLTASIDGASGTVIIMNSASLKEAVSLAWSQSLNTWLLI